MKVNLMARGCEHRMHAGVRGAGVLLFCGVLSACASGPNANPNDPLEPFNRGVYRFNDGVDKAVLKPVATAYQEVLPTPVRQGVANFFGNLEDAWSFVNNALQLKGQFAVDSMVRFGVNSFIGLGGILDVASEMSVEKHTKDFGHTLGYWGVAPGPYLVLPLLGPSTLRDTVALPVDMQGDIAANIAHVPTRNTVTAVRAVDKRAELLKASAMMEEAALDPYTFTRDAYLQHRRSSIFDGNPPDDGAENMFTEPLDLAQVPVETPAEMPTETLSSAGLSGAEKVNQ
jgi:phospholipid-binding lipoprotein MlaA